MLADDEAEAMPIAGGQSLVPMMNFRIARPGVLVDLGRVPGLDGITLEEGRLRIGAMTRYAALAGSDVVARAAPLIARVLPQIAHPAIRNRGTIGGSLALSDPAAEMPAIALVLGATLHVAGPEGERDIPAESFFHGMYDNALEPGELLTAVSFPAAAAEDRFGFHEIARRHGDYAMAGAMVARMQGAHRVSLFGIAGCATRAPLVEAALDTGASFAAEHLDDIEFAGDLNGGPELKRHWATVAVRRALEDMA